MDASDKGWKGKLFGLVKKYGSAARFAATTVLNAVVPGAPAVVGLVSQAFDAAMVRGLIQQRQRGLALLAAGRATEAEPALRKVAEARPDSAASQEALASAELVARHPAEAGRALTRAIRLRPNDAELSELH